MMWLEILRLRLLKQQFFIIEEIKTTLAMPTLHGLPLNFGRKSISECTIIAWNLPKLYGLRKIMFCLGGPAVMQESVRRAQLFVRFWKPDFPTQTQKFLAIFHSYVLEIMYYHIVHKVSNITF